MQEETSVSNNGISQQNAGNAQPIYGASKVSEKIITDEASDVKKKTGKRPRGQFSVLTNQSRGAAPIDP